MKNKYLRLIFITALAFGLSACGGATTEDTNTTTTGTTDTTGTSETDNDTGTSETDNDTGTSETDNDTGTSGTDNDTGTSGTDNDTGTTGNVIDTLAPVITITGDNPFYLYKEEPFVDLGATAEDNIDGSVVVTTSGEVISNIAGTYTITYTAIDKIGNSTIAKRTVIVEVPTATHNVSNVTEFRNALEVSASNGIHDKIVLSSGVYNMISDNLGTFNFSDNEEYNLTIEAEEGLTSKDVVLDGNSSGLVFKFDNSEKSTVIFKNISVINGKTTSTTNGGGVYSNQNIYVVDCNISNNIASSSYSWGGGFYAYGSTTVSGSTISNNTASNYGGGFYSIGNTTVLDSIISNNTANDGAGFYSSGVTNVSNSIISNNMPLDNSYHSSYYGGGFHSASSTKVLDSLISNNISRNNGAGFYSSGATTVVNSTISNNTSYASGGGFYSNSTTTVLNSRIYYNTAQNTSGFNSHGSTTIDSSFFNKNQGRVIYVYMGNLFLTNSLFTENNGTLLNSGDNIIINNSFINNQGGINTRGLVINNIFSKNSIDITLTGDSKIYNNYVEYTKIEDMNSYNVIKKNNIQESLIGDIFLNTDSSLSAQSPAIDNGLNPSSDTFETLINDNATYTKILKLLETDMAGNQRDYNNTIDMGAIEFASTK